MRDLPPTTVVCAVCAALSPLTLGLLAWATTGSWGWALAGALATNVAALAASNYLTDA